MIFVLGGNHQYTVIRQVGASGSTCRPVGHMDLLMNIPESFLEFFSWFSFVSFLNCPLLWHHPLLYLLKEVIYPHGQKYQYLSNGSHYLHSHFFALEFQAHHRIKLTIASHRKLCATCIYRTSLIPSAHPITYSGISCHTHSQSHQSFVTITSHFK